MTPRRMFCALMLGPQVALPLARAAARALLPAAAGLRCVAPADLHLTLAFAGALEPELAAGMERALARALTGAGAPRLWIGAAGAFPAWGRERVLVAGVEERGSGVLRDLARRAADAAAAAGLEPAAGGGFRPHVTLARVRPPARVHNKGLSRARIPPAFRALDFGLEWQPARAAWVESPGGGGGYRVVAEFPLEPERGDDPRPEKRENPIPRAWIPPPNP